MKEVTVTVRMSAEDKALIADFAKTFGMSVSQFMRDCALERIEDEIDAQAYIAAKAEFDADPVTYSMDEVMKEFGLA